MNIEDIPSCVIIPEETDFLIKYANRANMGMIELGCAEGRSSVVLGDVALKNEIILCCVDRWDEYDFKTWWQNVMTPNLVGTIFPYVGSTTEVSKILSYENHPYDFLFIDADHTYEGVKADFENYLPMLSLPATVVFHDIGYGGAKKFFDEIKDNYEHEVLDNIGVLIIK